LEIILVIIFVFVILIILKKNTAKIIYS